MTPGEPSITGLGRGPGWGRGKRDMGRKGKETRYCDVGKHSASELRQLPETMIPSGWICPQCWVENYQSYWPAWRTLLDFDDAKKHESQLTMFE